MGFSIGVPTPQGPQGTPEGTPANTPVSSDDVQTLPLVEQPVQDQMFPFTGFETPLHDAFYTASQQVPVLQKPVTENKKETVENKKETTKKEDHSGAGVDQTTDTPTHVSDEPKPQEEGEGQQGGGQGGSSGQDSGSSSNSGSFSGGGGQNPSHDQETAGVGVSQSIDETTGVAQTTTAGVVKEGDTIEGAKAGPINPLNDPTVVTALGFFTPPVNPAQFFSNGEKIMSELYAANVKFAATMPDGPDKMRFVDFLKMVQEALIGFQELLRSLQMQDSKGAQDRARAKLETSLAKIENQRKEQEEIFKKQEAAQAKMKIMGPLMAIFAFLMVALLSVIIIVWAMVLIMMGPLGWMALAALVAELIDQASKLLGKKPFAMQGLVNAVTTVTNAIVSSAADTFHLSPQEEKKAKLIGKTVAVSLCMTLAVVAAPAVFVFTGGAPLIAFLTESHIIRDMEIQAGQSESAASKAEMYATIAITAAFAIVAMALAFVMPIEAIGGAFLSIANTLAKYSLKAAEWMVSILKRIIDLGETAATRLVKTIQAMLQTVFDVEVWVTVTSTALQTTGGVMTYHYETLLADIARIQGQMDSDIELKETTIMILKKMIQQLLDGLQGFGQDIGHISQILKKTHSDVSQISSSLFG